VLRYYHKRKHGTTGFSTTRDGLQPPLSPLRRYDAFADAVASTELYFNEAVHYGGTAGWELSVANGTLALYGGGCSLWGCRVLRRTRFGGGGRGGWIGAA
jgi:hypothetical protein